MASPICEERVRQLAAEVKQIHAEAVRETDEFMRARQYGFSRHKAGADRIELQHTEKNVRVTYNPAIVGSISTVTLYERCDNVCSRDEVNVRLRRLDARKDAFAARGYAGGEFMPYKGFASECGFRYLYNVPLGSASDLDRLLDACSRS